MLNKGGVCELTLNDRHDGPLLDSRWALETVGVDATEKLSLQIHSIEGVGGLIVVRLDLTWKSVKVSYPSRGENARRTSGSAVGHICDK